MGEIDTQNKEWYIRSTTYELTRTRWDHESRQWKGKGMREDIWTITIKKNTCEIEGGGELSRQQMEHQAKWNASICVWWCLIFFLTARNRLENADLSSFRRVCNPARLFAIPEANVCIYVIHAERSLLLLREYVMVARSNESTLSNANARNGFKSCFGQDILPNNINWRWIMIEVNWIAPSHANSSSFDILDE